MVISQGMLCLIRNLSIQPNKKSYHMIIGLGIRIIDYEKSGKVAFLIPNFLTDVI